MENQEQAFQKWDFVRLKSPDQHPDNRLLDKNVNIYFIIEIQGQLAKVSNHEDFVPIEELLPIPINGVDDAQIYYDPIIAAGTYHPNEEVRPRKTDYSYYLDNFKRCFDTKGKSFYDIVQDKGFRYVHEVQRYLKEVGQENRLEIKAI